MKLGSWGKQRPGPEKPGESAHAQSTQAWWTFFFLGKEKSGSFARARCRRGRSEIPHFCSKLLLFALVL